MSRKSSLDFNLFARFATSELTHSGIWAWILQSIDPDCPSVLRELQAPARALLAKVGVTLEGAITVSRERKLPGKAGRVDIEAVDERGQVLVIETKVKATPDFEQRERYRSAYLREGMHLAGIAILSTTFDEPWYGRDAEHVGASEILDVLRAGMYDSPVMRDYVAWLEDEIAKRRKATQDALGEDLPAAYRALKDPAAQWGVMGELARKFGGPNAVRLYHGQNLDGSPWTQLSFAPGAPPKYDNLFYRLESRREVAEFTLRQYLKPVPPGKRQRLAWLRERFAVAQAAARPSIEFDTNPKGAQSRAQEAKVAQYSVPAGSIAALLRDLPAIHERFTKDLHANRWPLGPDRVAQGR